MALSRFSWCLGIRQDEFKGGMLSWSFFLKMMAEGR
jgi:hypothetical protein